MFFGKGFGDLPDSLSWLRPFAVTAAFVDEVPVGSTRTPAWFGRLSFWRLSEAVPRSTL
jgi:hypothetical protein